MGFYDHSEFPQNQTYHCLFQLFRTSWREMFSFEDNTIFEVFSFQIDDFSLQSYNFFDESFSICNWFDPRKQLSLNKNTDYEASLVITLVCFPTFPTFPLFVEAPHCFLFSWLVREEAYNPHSFLPTFSGLLGDSEK